MKYALGRLGVLDVAVVPEGVNRLHSSHVGHRLTPKARSILTRYFSADYDVIRNLSTMYHCLGSVSCVRAMRRMSSAVSVTTA